LVQLELIGGCMYMIPLHAMKAKLNNVCKTIIDLMLDLKAAVSYYAQYFYEQKEEYFVKLLRLREKFYEVEKSALRDSGIHAAFATRIGFCYELLVNLQDTAICMERKQRQTQAF
jgi:hypothetical protein